MARIAFIIGCCVALLSCEPGDLVDVPVNNPRLVVLSAPESGQPWIVYVSHTEPVMGRVIYPEEVENATVKIFENDELLEQLEYVPDPDTVPFSNPYDLSPYLGKTTSPVPGHTYRITVDAAGYESVSSQYTQPAVVDIEDFKIQITGGRRDKPSPDFQYIMKTMQVSVTFTDPPGDNYYWFDLTGTDSVDIYKGGNTGSLFLWEDSRQQVSDEVLRGVLTSDREFANQTITLKFNTYQYAWISQQDTSALPYLQFSLRNITKEYYDYRYSTTQPGTYYYDPYIQPTTIKNNIDKGLGIFSGYSASRRNFEYDPY